MIRPNSATLRWLIPYFGRARGAWIAAILATIVASATEPLVPALLKPLLDKGFQAGGIPLWMVPAALLLIFAVRGFAGFLADIALAKITQDGLLLLRRDMFARLLDARLALFGEQNATALSNTVVFEVQNGATLLVNAVIGLLKDSVALIALLAYLLYLNWQLTLIVFLIVPGVAWLIRTVSKRLYRIARATQTATNDLAYVVEENVLAARVVRLHGAQASQAERFFGLSSSLRRLAMKTAVASATITPMTHMLAAAALSIVICIALWQSRGGITVGTFASFITAMLMLIAPIKRVSEVANPISRGLAAVQRAMDLIEKTPAESGGTHAADRARGHIEFKDVSVVYREDAQPALDQVSLVVEPGQVIALVGPSGSGKTTLANLLPRFVQPTAGTVLLDEHAVTDWKLDSLRRQFALVSQDVVMFNDTLAANIALGSQMDKARVAQCAEAANLGDVVAALPDGLDTMVGHNAAQLSGGQRQRLAIARALYKDAPILILDEATSALDTASERQVQEALTRLMAGRTTLIIAHRLSTIEHADRVVVLDQGRIAESGSHAQLVASGGLYARLHALQFGAQ
ncbi:lipid A export permease/ATP-binding protein MsbA [Caenimonas koreensis DSM 17982]|uniref:Lipid A export permease/ATP-binding protein MsbA n=1 Tax=Caenimonas koreensis DSM 17982 TaxID=1121255 RepID=A0A844AWM7_9BURK|nr:lipid A export permease/ATP-binding protein MsbA [Caenimonas koreensis]MRD48484.1 lipid A export permease/ATP-binding protein MsbA [Caenimonas koreensis DSM 17982]